MSSLNALKITKDNLEYNTDEKQNTVTTDIGTILLYAGTTINNISNNFLLCDGTSHEIGDYPELFGIIGIIYGGTVTHFNVPNFKMHMPLGSKEGVNTINYQGVNKISGGNSSIESNQFKHSHDVSGNYVGGYDTNKYEPVSTSGRSYKHTPSNVSSRETSYNLDASDNEVSLSEQINYYPKYTTLNYIICYKT